MGHNAQLFLLRQGLENYLPLLILNSDLPDLHLLSS
jgi:hypothetical protein